MAPAVVQRIFVKTEVVRRLSPEEEEPGAGCPILSVPILDRKGGRPPNLRSTATPPSLPHACSQPFLPGRRQFLLNIQSRGAGGPPFLFPFSEFTANEGAPSFRSRFWTERVGAHRTCVQPLRRHHFHTPARSLSFRADDNFY